MNYFPQIKRNSIKSYKVAARCNSEFKERLDTFAAGYSVTSPEVIRRSVRYWDSVGRPELEAGTKSDNNKSTIEARVKFFSKNVLLYAQEVFDADQSDAMIRIVEYFLQQKPDPATLPDPVPIITESYEPGGFVTLQVVVIPQDGQPVDISAAVKQIEAASCGKIAFVAANETQGFE